MQLSHGMDGCQNAEKKILRGKEIVRKSTRVRINTSTYCHPFSLLLSVISVKAWKKTHKKGFKENMPEMKLLPGPLTQDVFVSLTVPAAFHIQLSRWSSVYVLVCISEVWHDAECGGAS